MLKNNEFAAVEQNELESVNGGLSRGNMGGSLGVGDFGVGNVGGMVTLPNVGFDRPILGGCSGLVVVQPGLVGVPEFDPTCLRQINICIGRFVQAPPDTEESSLFQLV